MTSASALSCSKINGDRFSQMLIFRLLPPPLRESIQVLLFSATFPKRVKDYIPKFAPNANSLTLKTSELTVKGISQMFIDCPDENARYNILCKLYGLMTIGQSVIFVKVCTACFGLIDYGLI